MHLPCRRLALLTLSIVPLFASAGCSPWFMSRDKIVVTGEFRADGSCVVQSDGGPLYGAADSARTFFKVWPNRQLSDPGSNYLEHTIACRPRKRELSDPRDFYLTIEHRGPAIAGEYTAVHWPPSDSAINVLVATFADPRYRLGTPGAGVGGDLGDIRLIVDSGAVNITRMDSTLVTGTFRVLAVRRWHTGIS